MESPILGEESDWTKVASLPELPLGAVLRVSVGSNTIALYNVDGDVFASDAVCTHEFAELTDGFLDGNIIECPLHGGCFDVRTGKGQGEPIEVDLKVYPVRVIGDDIEVRLSL
jgi:nitrite reductase/ring-hydroxylating ferredoxin subunit